MRDSYLNVYHGPIRGGKTISMTADIIINMINGRKAFTNYPIEFSLEVSPGVFRNYSSEIFNSDEIMLIDRDEIKKKYTESIIGWDEGALSMPARDFQSAENKLESQAMLLRGKLGMSIYFTVQYLSMWEKNMRLQEDNRIFCHDLSFMYPKSIPQRGLVVSQTWQDQSGRSTGMPYELTQRGYRQTFYAHSFWDTYDTTKTFPVVRNKISMQDVRNTLSEYDVTENEESNLLILQHTVEEFIVREQFRITAGILYEMAHRNGFQGKKTDIGISMINLGYRMSASGMWCLD